ncbi:MAG: dsRBD fold-containing protein [Micromonospora sp.]
MPEIGDELAVSRALADLVEKLRVASVADVKQLTPEGAPHGR